MTTSKIALVTLALLATTAIGLCAFSEVSTAQSIECALVPSVTSNIKDQALALRCNREAFCANNYANATEEHGKPTNNVMEVNCANNFGIYDFSKTEYLRRRLELVKAYCSDPNHIRYYDGSSSQEQIEKYCDDHR
jgi:hypothetical protein